MRDSYASIRIQFLRDSNRWLKRIESFFCPTGKPEEVFGSRASKAGSSFSNKTRRCVLTAVVTAQVINLSLTLSSSEDRNKFPWPRILKSLGLYSQSEHILVLNV